MRSPLIFSFVLAVATALPAQVRNQPAPHKPAPHEKVTRQALSPRKGVPITNRDQRFALDVLQAAVSVSVSDPQDRLRVLASAISVASPIAPALAKQWSREGARVEAELISSGHKPDVSVLALGTVDCKAASNFTDQITPANVPIAEQALIGVAANCGPTAKNAVRVKADAAMHQGIVAPRLMMALMSALGPKTAWSQQTFVQLFSSLPEAKDNSAEAPNFAAMYANMAAEVDKETARDAGAKLLLWLGKVDPGGPRNLAVNITTDAMKKTLGEEAYQRALERDPLVRQTADTAGQPGEISRPEEESASALEAMRAQKAGDQSDALRDLPVSQRARQAAALGFAAGTAGDLAGSERYFDMAFSAADETWANRGTGQNAAAIVSEVCDAAAQVNPVKALARAQKLGEPAGQAIGMVAVARVVASKSAQ